MIPRCMVDDGSKAGCNDCALLAISGRAPGVGEQSGIGCTFELPLLNGHIFSASPLSRFVGWHHFICACSVASVLRSATTHIKRTL